jgi:hypothetical protein
MAGKSELRLELTEDRAQRQRLIRFFAATAKSTEKAAVARSAKRILGGAGLGAAIGAIAGNAGMGVAIGAVAGITAAVCNRVKP